MSRTKKSSKGPGYDYWGRRALSADCGYGPIVKKITKKIERNRAKKALRSGDIENFKNKEAI